MAFITFSVPYHGHRAMVVPAAKAAEIQDFLNNPPDDLTEEQSEFLLAIKQIYPGTRTYTEPDTSHLTNPGVLQGMNEILPRGDR